MRFKLWGKDPAGKGGLNEAAISSRGEVITRPFAYSQPFFQNLNVVDTAFNFAKPTTGKRFVVVGTVISGNRDIGVNGSITVIYGAETETSTTVAQTIAEVEVPKSDVFPFVIPNVLVNEGLFVNGKCDDNSVRVTLYIYEVPA